MVQASPGLSDGGGVAQHADSPLDLGQVSSWHHSWGLIVDAHLESSGAPVNKLDGSLGLDGGNGGIHILGHNITPVQHAASHVLSVPRVALDHLKTSFVIVIGTWLTGFCKFCLPGWQARSRRW